MMSFEKYLKKNKNIEFEEFTGLSTSMRMVLTECYNIYVAEQLSFPPERKTWHEDEFSWDRLPVPKNTPYKLLREIETTLG